MIINNRRPVRSRAEAPAAFINKKLEIDALLSRLQALSDEHFNIDPTTIRWCDVETLTDYARTLQNISDQAFNEGEFGRGE